jgi:nucleoside-diphosphate-sugar epimerase
LGGGAHSVKAVLVTGGGGFLGGAIVAQLLARGVAVRSLSRGDYPELSTRGVQVIQGDVADPEQVLCAVQGCDTVFHVAARAGIWGPRDEFVRTNVLGTENVIAACRKAAVLRLVFTSSPSVVHSGDGILRGDESMPYRRRYNASYPATKAHAEQAVLRANGPTLATVALRPHLIWGPGDNHLLPRLLGRAKAGRLRFVGPPAPLVDSTYIADAARAHLLAASRLHPGSACAGRVYFITQGEPWPMDQLVNGLLRAAGHPPVARYIGAWTAKAAGWFCEGLYGALGLRTEPPVTRFLAEQLSTAHFFDITAAGRDLGYAPERSISEGLILLAASGAMW